MTTMAPTATQDQELVVPVADLVKAIQARDVRIAQERSVQHEQITKVMERMRESVRSDTGIDPKKIAWSSPFFRVRPLREAMYRITKEQRLREATAETSFGQLLRYGVQHYLFDAYQNVATVYQAIFDSRPSSNRQEWYAPLYGAEVPEDVDPGARFDDSRIRGLDVMIVNKKVGRILSVERELVDDDQTGQIVQRASRLGERMRYKEELDAMSAIVNALDFSPGGGVTAAGYSTAIGNRPTTLGALAQGAMEAAAIALRKMKDPLGNFMLVQPDTVLVGPDNEINLYKLLNSAYQPSIPGVPGTLPYAVGTGTGVAFETQQGMTGYTLTANWLQGRYTPVVSTFLAHPAINGTNFWYLLQAKRGQIIQERDPLEVVQENPLSGEAFDFDSYRYRVRRRYKHAVVEPRFIFEGNGSQYLAAHGDQQASGGRNHLWAIASGGGLPR
jgi:hypothetical protein